MKKKNAEGVAEVARKIVVIVEAQAGMGLVIVALTTARNAVVQGCRNAVGAMEVEFLAIAVKREAIKNVDLQNYFRKSMTKNRTKNILVGPPED